MLETAQGIVVRRFVSIITIVALAAASCGGDDEESAPTTLPPPIIVTSSTSTTTATTTTTTSTTTTTTSTTTTTTIPSIGPPLDLDDPALFAEPPEVSYTMSFEFTFNGTDDDGESLLGWVRASGGRTLEPADADVTVIPEGPADFGVCASLAEDETFTDPYDVFLSGGDFLTGEARLIEIGLEVEVPVRPGDDPDGTAGDDGSDQVVVVDRYALTSANLDPGSSLLGEAFEIDVGHVDVARGGYLAAVFLQGAGIVSRLSGSQTGVGVVVYDLRFSRFGETSEVPVPVDCAGR